MNNAILTPLRRGFWHLRNGGLGALREHVRRQDPAGTGPGPLRSTLLSLAAPVRRRRPRFEPAQLAAAVPANLTVHAGVIMDEFSLAGFEWEWRCTPLAPGTTAGDMEALGLDLVLIESAWAANGGAWRYKLLGSSGPAPQIRELIDAVRSLGIPVVFWNKEDPPHYEDFLPLARLCDYVFTSDQNMLPRYRSDLGHDQVGCLPFAAQPKIHNPVRPRHGWQERDVAFAGMYFAHKYPERREQMDIILPAAADACSGQDYSFEIFSRQLGRQDEYQFPAPLDKYVAGSLDYAQMLTAYKAYKVFLNVNSVVDSSTMCSRRVFEMTAAGATVVSTPSPAMLHFFPEGELPLVDSRQEAANVIRTLLNNPDYAQRLVHLAQRRIWAGHTYRHRAEQILRAVRPQLAATEDRPLVSVLASSIRPDQLDHVIEGVASQRGVDVQLVYGAHGFAVDLDQFHRKCREAGIADASALEFPAEMTLGECLNALAEKASGEFAAKWDDDDLYGPWYLFDQLQALDYSGAAVVGKMAHYMHFQAPAVTVLRNSHLEHRYSHFVAGPTLFARLETFREHPFPAVNRGEDTTFLRTVLESGRKIYAADRFNYCQVRSADHTQHTWQVSAGELLASSSIKFFGNPVEQVFL
ncbi:glycosyltransferase [Arthrobacter mobilis]|uniref:Glycosyltransferase n=1 Tax=Arthrobacter mobilis TaxID=2724944 RepID=A0A7X6HDZ5_9MICC|nr:glycosyltransferase [Arthrobacter mobilis]NKX55363.1 glycosyltransferase [Arthrobacter mobilis]